MQEKHLYEYSVIRVVPVLEREEFLNTGIIVFCKRSNFIKVLISLNEEKLRSFGGELDVEQAKLSLAAFEKTALGLPDGGPIAQLDVPSRFRWLTAVRSSSIQTSRPHPGYSNNLEETAQRLLKELVL